MTTHLRSAMVVCIALLISFAVQPSGQATAPPSGQTSKPSGQAATAKPGSLAMTVVTESGGTLQGAAVSLRGAVDRQALAAADGVATLLNIPAGTYRTRISRDGYVTFEKEVSIRAGVRATSEAALTAAPAAPPPPPQAPKETPKPTPSQSQSEPRGPLGAAKVLSLLDLAEQMLGDKAPLVEREIGCSVATASQLILIRETLDEPHARGCGRDGVSRRRRCDIEDCRQGHGDLPRLVRHRSARLGTLDREARPQRADHPVDSLGTALRRLAPL